MDLIKDGEYVTEIKFPQVSPGQTTYTPEFTIRSGVDTEVGVELYLSVKNNSPHLRYFAQNNNGTITTEDDKRADSNGYVPILQAEELANGMPELGKYVLIQDTNGNSSPASVLPIALTKAKIKFKLTAPSSLDDRIQTENEILIWARDARTNGTHEFSNPNRVSTNDLQKKTSAKCWTGYR